MRDGGPSIERFEVGAYRIPTDQPESDGTIAWDVTSVVVVRAHAGGQSGLGYSYAHPAAGEVIDTVLSEVLIGRDAFATPGAWQAMAIAVRNVGRPGIASSAIAATDMALWDLKARLLDLPFVDLLGRAREGIAVYGSGGFASYDLPRLREQLGGWAASGMRFVKMKIGREPKRDPERVTAVREAIGPEVELFVDANGAFDRPAALAMAHALDGLGVTWFEEPVSSDDLAGLALVRQNAPPGMAVAAGEYGYDLPYFGRMLGAGAVDCLQADSTRCGGPTVFLGVAGLCEAHCLPLSAHTAPSIHAHLCCALPVARHVEYFHDHARVERLLFDGVLEPCEGALWPDRSRPGLGLELKGADAARYAL
jgi:L-alanine-DL-glutamate epimerase-like enolase superfamily enzyme